jgi:hypothetical protein
LHLIWVVRAWPGLRNQASRWLAAWGLSTAGILVVTLAIHRLMYRLGHIPMPLGRRAVFVVPLCMLAIGALVALRAAARRAAWVRAAALAMLWVTAAYFIGCLRLTYFMEWKYNADAKDLYSVVAYYNHTYKVRDVSSNWRYVAVLNFYRTLSGHESLEEIPSGPAEVAAYPPGKPLYAALRLGRALHRPRETEGDLPQSDDRRHGGHPPRNRAGRLPAGGEIEVERRPARPPHTHRLKRPMPSRNISGSVSKLTTR